MRSTSSNPVHRNQTVFRRGEGFRLLFRGAALRLLLLPILLPALPAQVFPGLEKGGTPREDRKGEPGGELLLFQEIPLVVSAAREATTQALSPAPVSVFTAEEINWAGLTSIPDILRFLPGMDVVIVDRLRYAVGVRGLHSFAADRTLALIDGRNATHPAWGGTMYNFLPLMVEDIDRVEAVRGPIGAAWGANAFNGVVNFITKKPEDTQGLTFTGKIDRYGDHRTFLRWGSRAGDLSWRISTAYQYDESSSDALQGEDFDSNDSCKSFRFDARGAWKAGRNDRLSFGAAHAWNRTGDFEQMGYWPKKKGVVLATRLFARHDHTFESGGKGYLQFFCNREWDSLPSEGRAFSTEYDMETQVSGKWAEGHQVTVGGNFRFVYVNPKRPRKPQEFWFVRDQVHEYWAGIFVSDTWFIRKETALDLQLRTDQYSGTGMDWSGRLSWIEEIQEGEKQVLRFSLARSFRAPLPVFRRMNLNRLPMGGGLYAYHLEANGDLHNEEIYSLEIGYTWNPEDSLSFKVNTYYQFLDDLINAENYAPTFYRMENQGRGRAYGGEIEADWKVGFAGLGFWYGYDGFHSKARDRNYRSFRPTDHNAGVKALVGLPAGFRCALFYRYSDAVRTPALHHLPVMHRLDLSLSKTFSQGKAVFQVGVEDLFHRKTPLVYAEGSLMGHETPGRILFARLVLNF